MIRKYKKLLFDLDNTLVDDDENRKYAFEKILVQRKEQVTNEKLEKFIQLDNQYWKDRAEGILNGEKIRLIGQGKPGENGGKNGDLFLKINIESNSKFKLQGYDLYTDLFLTPWEAALGTRANIKTIDDETKVYIPKGIQSGEKIKIPGKGYKTGTGTRGDLVAEVKVMVPKQLTEEEKTMFEKLNEISNFNPRNNR